MDDKLIMVTFDEDGKAIVYDNEFDVTIHCKTKEEMEEVIRELKSRRWIPIKEKEPDTGAHVLVTYNDGVVEELDYNVDKYFNGELWKRVVAWMYMPDPARLEDVKWEK